MTIPGFTADAAIYEGAGQYRVSATRSDRGTPGVTPASIIVDPCRRCSRMTGCAKSRCLCQCDGGIAMSNSHAHCGFLCT